VGQSGAGPAHSKGLSVGGGRATALCRHRAAMGDPLDDEDGDRAEEENVDKAALMQDELFHKPNERQRDA